MKLKQFSKLILLSIAFLILLFNQSYLASALSNKLDNMDGSNRTLANIVNQDHRGLNTTTSLPVLVSHIIQLVLGLFGTIALIFIIRAGIMWMGSKGDSGKIKEARKIMTAGLIGLIIIAISYAITDFVLKQIMVTVG